MNLVTSVPCRSELAASYPIAERPKPATRVRLNPRLSVVIVNYRQWPDTADLVSQLVASHCVRQEEAEVVVVDNHSPPHPLGARMRRWSGVSLRRWERNYGFARAVNEGCRLSRGEWFLLLNPDVSVTSQFLDGALKLVEQISTQEPRAGIIGLQLYNSDGTPQLSSGPFPTLAGTLARMFLPRPWRKYHFLNAAQRCQVDWVTGCCLLVRRECLQDLKGFDPDFFLYYEDVDLCRRARECGWSVWFDPSANVTHHNPLHSRAVPPHLRVFTRHALLRYASKHWPRWQFELLAGIVCAEAWARQRSSSLAGDESASDLYRELRAIAVDLVNQRVDVAKHRLDRIVRQEEKRLAAPPVDRHSFAQSS